MTYADLLVTLGALCLLLLVPAGIYGLCRVAHRWFCEALDSVARDIP